MNWQSSANQELLDIKIKETELKIEALQLKLKRLNLERKGTYSNVKEESVSGSSTSKVEEEAQECIGIEDFYHKLLYVGDTVELRSSSKGTSYFQKGDKARVEGLHSEKRVLISDLQKPSETTNRTGNNLILKARIVGGKPTIIKRESKRA